MVKDKNKEVEKTTLHISSTVWSKNPVQVKKYIRRVMGNMRDLLRSDRDRVWPWEKKGKKAYEQTALYTELWPEPGISDRVGGIVPLYQEANGDPGVTKPQAGQGCWASKITFVLCSDQPQSSNSFECYL